MKTLVCVGVLCAFIVVVSPAFADYTNPPNWSTSPAYTHQLWNFSGTGASGDQEPAQPLVADGGYQNIYGTPVATWDQPQSGMFDWLADVMGQPDIAGRAGFVGGMVAGNICLDIPNLLATSAQELWVQYVVLAGSPSEVSVSIDNAGASYVGQLESVDLGPGGTSGTFNWYRVSELWRINPSVPVDKITLSAAPSMGPVMVDSVAADTRMIPEAAPVVLVGFGCVVFLLLRRG